MSKIEFRKFIELFSDWLKNSDRLVIKLVITIVRDDWLVGLCQSIEPETRPDKAKILKTFDPPI